MLKIKNMELYNLKHNNEKKKNKLCKIGNKLTLLTKLTRKQYHHKLTYLKIEERYLY